MLSCITTHSEPFNMSLNFMCKDIFGQLGGLYFVHRLSSDIDKAPIRYGNYHNILFQTSIILECITPMCPTSLFIPVTVVANIGKNISFIGLGSIQAKCIKSLSDKKDNPGQVYSQIAIANTIASSFGMILGLFITYLIPCHLTRLICMEPIFFILRMYSYNKMIRVIFKKKIDNKRKVK